MVTRKDGDTIRSAQPALSETKRKFDAFRATPVGALKDAESPFPSVVAAVPLPAIVVTIPFSVTSRNR